MFLSVPISLTKATLCTDCTDDEQDPLSTLATSIRIHQIMDDELCDKPSVKCKSERHEPHEKCRQILNCYGERPFKCKYPGCESWRHGFETRTRREHHQLAHETPLKCHIAGCKFGRIGFLSEKMRERHLQEGHSSDPPQAAFHVCDLGSDSVEPLLHYLVTDDQVDHVVKILSKLPDADRYKTQNLRMLASLTASPAMLRLFWSNLSEKERIQCTIESIKGRNQNTMEANLMLLSQPIQRIASDPRLNQDDIEWQLVSRNWVEGMRMWCKSARHQVETDLSSLGGFDRVKSNIKRYLSCSSLLRAAAKHPSGEQAMIHFWNDTGLLCFLDAPHNWASRTLTLVAKFGCSVTLASELLRMGASINDRLTVGEGKHQKTPLHWAATNNSAAGAKMMEFLLFAGADPNATVCVPSGREAGSTRMIRDEKGAKGIQKWLGKCWDDLVEETKHIRLEKQFGQPAISDNGERCSQT